MWMRTRYYCNNTTGLCKFALGDIPFSKSEFEKSAGSCRGRAADGCGQALISGDPQDLRPRIFAAVLATVALAACLGWLARTYVFPPPLQHVAFTGAESSVDDKVGTLELKIVRDSNLDQRIAVEIGSTDGTAKAGLDYQPVSGSITFERGERAKVIELSVLPDQTLEKGPRSFTVTLLNVQGEPHHIVRIGPRVVDRSERLQAEQMILSASRIAADIAGLMVKRRVLLQMATDRSATPAVVAEYKKQFIDMQDNLSRAREGYADAMRELQKFDTTLVLPTMDHVRDDLAKRTFGQQSRALDIMKLQFKELSSGQPMDMDRWVSELERAVPHLDANGHEVTA